MRKSNKSVEVPTWDTVPDHVMDNVMHVGRRGYRESGRGFVLVHLKHDQGPNNWELAYVPPDGASKFQTFSSSTAASIQRNTAIYDPETQVSVVLFDHRYPHGARTAVLQDANALSAMPSRANA
jgi:hypothetical protein